MSLKKNILVVGGSGFIGYNLVKKLKYKKKYRIFSISSKKKNKHRIIKGVNYIRCDITKKKELVSKLKKKNIDYVINLAGYVDHQNKKKTYNTHFKGCKNLADFYLNRNIKKFIQLGSSTEYGDKKSPQKEKYKVNIKDVKSIYGKSKLKASQLLLKYNKEKKFPAVIFRLYIAYGPHQDTNRLIPYTINACLKKKKFPCTHGNQLRDFIFIDDLIHLLVISLNNDKIDGQIFNVGLGKPIKVKNIIKLIQKNIKKGIPEFGKIKLRKDEILLHYPSIDKLKKYFNWKPKIKFNTGIKKTINYYEEKYI